MRRIESDEQREQRIDFRDEHRADVFWRLHQMGERGVYRALLAYSRVHKKKDDAWVSRSFREIFGTNKLPKGCDTEPLPDFYIIEEWIAYR